MTAALQVPCCVGIIPRRDRRPLRQSVKPLVVYVSRLSTHSVKYRVLICTYVANSFHLDIGYIVSLSRLCFVVRSAAGLTGDTRVQIPQIWVTADVRGARSVLSKSRKLANSLFSCFPFEARCYRADPPKTM